MSRSVGDKLLTELLLLDLGELVNGEGVSKRATHLLDEGLCLACGVISTSGIA